MLDLLVKRRSIRKYKDRDVEREKIDAIVKAALLSPSSRGICPWEFIVVTDSDSLQKLSNCKKGSAAFLADAPLGIVVLADGNKSDVWVEDASIASTLIQLEAEELNLGSCWIQIRGRMHDENKTAGEYIREELSIPENLSVESIIAIGYPDEEKFPHRIDELKYDVVYREEYGHKY